MTLLIHKGLGVTFGGICPICNTHTGDRPYQRAITSLYQDRTDGTFYTVHPRCAGGSTKGAVGGGAKYRVDPKHILEIPKGRD